MSEGSGQSVYQRVLGDGFEGLAPELRRYFSLPEPGTHGEGEGVFEIAGSRHRWLLPLFALLARRAVLFPEYEERVPFSVVNRPSGGSLAAQRRFRFRRRDRLMVDEMTVVDGRLHDVLGGLIEVALELAVDGGALRMRSTRAWVRLGRRRVRLPALLSARVLLTEAWERDHQRVEVVLRHPLLGVIFEYRGTFTYEVVPD